MNSTYLFLCGVAWCQFGEESAGSELIRALSSADQKVRALARAMLVRAGERSKALLAEAVARHEISQIQASLCMFEKREASKLPVSKRQTPGLAATA
jgi:hypothetical protein